MPRFLIRLAEWFAMAGCLCACAMALMTVASIAGRNIGPAPIAGDIELTQLGVAFCIAWCLPWCQLRGAHIGVDFFTQAASARTRRGMDAMGALLMALVAALLAWRTAAGALAVHEAAETTMILGLAMWPAHAALVPGLALAALIAAIQSIQHLQRK